MRHIGLIIAIAAMFSATASQAEPSDIKLMAMTELRASSGGHFITSADINGTAIKVLVDTGATVVALSFEDARHVGLRPHNLDFDVPVSTANGIAKAARVRLDRIVIDGIEVDDVDGLVLPEGALRGTLLGMSFLGRLGSFRVEDGVLYLRD